MTSRDKIHPGTRYRIIVQGELDSKWANWFNGLTISQAAHGETELVGPVADQAALHGILAKIRDLGLPLLSVQIVSE